MKKRPATMGDGVPREIIEEITDRLHAYESHEPTFRPKASEDDFARLLASFEADLMKLNRELEREASVKMKAVRAEYEETREAVSELNTELDDVVEENIGTDGAFRT